jgi:peptide/nickel transport system substrate-binding protein
VGLGIVLALVVGVMLIPSATPGNAAVSPSPLAVAPYREGVVGHPSSVNPLTARSQADQDLVALLFRSLVRAGPDDTILPDLASSWTASADGRTYTFRLVTDAYWEDGQPVTSADVVFTIGLLQDPNYDGLYGSSWQGIHVAASGPYTVTFTMVLAIAGFLHQAELPILPQHLLAGVDVTKLADVS